MNRILYLIGIAAIAMPLWAGEYVVLGHGFRLHADRHEVSGEVVKIFSADSVTELPALGWQSAMSWTTRLFQRTTRCWFSAGQWGQAVPPAERPSPQQLASEAAKKFSLPESFVRSVMRAESGFAPAAVSPKGAIGLMQLMPETARQLGVDPANPRENACRRATIPPGVAGKV